MYARSPVASHPSMIVSFVAFSLFQYFSITIGPLKSNSPISFVGSSRLVIGSTTFASVTGVRTPMEFSVAEKMALRRLSELEKIVKGVSSKWFKNKSDLAMIDQTQAEMGRIKDVLNLKREKFGVE